jgi:hypothetical protein
MVKLISILICISSAACGMSNQFTVRFVNGQINSLYMNFLLLNKKAEKICKRPPENTTSRKEKEFYYSAHELTQFAVEIDIQAIPEIKKLTRKVFRHLHAMHIDQGNTDPKLTKNQIDLQLTEIIGSSSGNN